MLYNQYSDTILMQLATLWAIQTVNSYYNCKWVYTLYLCYYLSHCCFLMEIFMTLSCLTPLKLISVNYD